MSLFAYLLLLGAGALWLDRRKPWPETTPLAVAGTLLLYAGLVRGPLPARAVRGGGGRARRAHRPLRRWARRARSGRRGTRASSSLAVLGLPQLVDGRRPAGGAARPVARPRLRGPARPRPPSARASPSSAAAAVAVPFAAWAARALPCRRASASPRRGSWAAPCCWPSAGPPATLPGGALPGLAVVAGGLASVGLAARTDRPAALLALLAAQALLAARHRETVGLDDAGRRRRSPRSPSSPGTTATSGRSGRAEALALGVTVAGLYVLILAVEGFASGRALGMPGAVAHVVAAGLAWTILDRVLGADPAVASSAPPPSAWAPSTSRWASPRAAGVATRCAPA